MTDNTHSFTSATLLGRLTNAATDEGAWQEFVDRYGPRVLRWCRAQGCPSSQIEDTLQEVLIKLLQAFKSFRYDPSKRFRSWLQTVVRSAVMDFHRSHKQLGTGETDAWMQLQQIPAEDDLYQQINAAFDLELFDCACSMAKAKFNEQTWMAFELTEIKQIGADEAAVQLGMKTSHLYVARGRVKSAIKQEIERLTEEMEGTTE